MKTDPFQPITRERAAEILDISLGTLDAMVRDGALPPPRPIGNARKLYWDPDIFYARLRMLLGEDGSCARERTTLAMPIPEPTAERSRAASAKGSPSERARMRQQARVAELNR